MSDPAARRSREFDRGMIVGVGLACSIMQSCYDQPTMVAEVLAACALNRAKLKRAGLPDYDLKILRPAFRELRRDDR